MGEGAWSLEERMDHESCWRCFCSAEGSIIRAHHDATEGVLERSEEKGAGQGGCPGTPARARPQGSGWHSHGGGPGTGVAASPEG